MCKSFLPLSEIAAFWMAFTCMIAYAEDARLFTSALDDMVEPQFDAQDTPNADSPPGERSPELLIAPFGESDAQMRQQEWAKFLNTDAVVENSIRMTMTIVRPGEFDMGSTQGERDRVIRTWPTADSAVLDDEGWHRVRLTQPFLVSVHEVTVGQFRSFTVDADYVTEAEREGGGQGWDELNARFDGPKPDYTWEHTGWTPFGNGHPVVNVTFLDAIAFCNWLSRHENLDEYYEVASDVVNPRGGNGYRLLTEAEWEYACRAGTTTMWQNGDDPTALASLGNVPDRTAKTVWTNYQNESFIYTRSRDGFAFTAPVGQFAANAFGLHDMHGNVWEWCWDVFDAEAFNNLPGASTDPVVNGPANLRVLRSGSWADSPQFSRSASRIGHEPSHRFYSFGFRVARSHR